MTRRLIVTSMRNEAPFILEWLVYHRLIGFNDFLVFSNDCDDGTDEMLDRLQALGWLTHLDNPREGNKTVQWQALNRAWKTDNVKAAEWIFVSDVDEFLTIHPGAGTLDDLFNAQPEAEGFILSWRMFGNNGHYTRQPGLVMENFTSAAPDALVWPWRAVQFKTLFRRTPHIQKLGVHSPRRKKDAPPPKLVDDSGRSLPEQKGTLIIHPRPRYEVAQLNHYALGSVEDFLIKVDRGKPNRSDDATDLAYWVERNFNTQEDRSILRHADAVRQGVAELLADPVLAALHERAEAWRRRRLEELMLDPAFFYLQANIQLLGSTEVLPMARQQSILRQLRAAIAHGAK